MVHGMCLFQKKHFPGIHSNTFSLQKQLGFIYFTNGPGDDWVKWEKNTHVFPKHPVVGAVVRGRVGTAVQVRHFARRGAARERRGLRAAAQRCGRRHYCAPPRAATPARCDTPDRRTFRALRSDGAGGITAHRRRARSAAGARAGAHAGRPRRAGVRRRVKDADHFAAFFGAFFALLFFGAGGAAAALFFFAIATGE